MSHEWKVCDVPDDPGALEMALNDLTRQGCEIRAIHPLERQDCWRVIARQYVPTPAEPEEENAFFEL